MESKAILKYARISPRKVQIVLDLIRGQSAEKAAAILKFTPKAASEPLAKLLKSAVANAENAENLRANDLYVSQIFVDEGVTARRFRARAKGQGARIMKRASHITAVVEPLAGKGEGIPMPKQAVTKRFETTPVKPTRSAESAVKPSVSPTKVKAEATEKVATKPAKATPVEVPKKAAKPAKTAVAEDAVEQTPLDDAETTVDEVEAGVNSDTKEA